MARAEARKFTSTFHKDWRYFLGEDHWPTATNWRHMSKDTWKAKTVRNYVFQTIDFKKAVVLDATPSIHAEPLSVDVDTMFLEMAENAVEHELKRLNWDKIRSKMFMDGAVLGKGIAHVFTKKDKLSGELTVCLESVDPARFYPDPQADCLDECSYVVYEPEWDLSTIREVFPEKGALVTPKKSTPVANMGISQTTRRTNDELLTGPGGEFRLNEKGDVNRLRADVCLIYIKDDMIRSNVKSVLLKEETVTQMCDDCGAQSLTKSNQCPECGSPNVSFQITPPEYGEETEVSRAYPFGRLIAIAGDVELYDGPSPYELECIFPFVDYTHYPVNRRYWGYGDLALLKSCQMVADKNVAQLLDAMRMTAQGKFEFPIGAQAYEAVGNAPGESYPVPPELAGMARWVVPQGYNGQLHQVLDETNLRDFQRVSGISDVSAGVAPNAPTSGVEVQARQRAAATRIGTHLKEMNSASSKIANIVFQLMRQNYVGPRTFMTQNPYSEYVPIAMDISMLPREIAIKVSADPDEIERDRLQGQNVMGLITSGMLFNPMMLPFLDILLPSMGIRPQMARELQKRLMMMPPPVMAPAPGNGSSGSPPAGTPSETAPGQADTEAAQYN